MGESAFIAPLILTYALDAYWVVKFMAQPIYSQERTRLPIEQEEAWAPEPVRQFWKRENLLLLLGFVPQTIQPKASCYTNYATPAHKAFIFRVKLPNKLII